MGVNHTLCLSAQDTWYWINWCTTVLSPASFETSGSDNWQSDDIYYMGEPSPSAGAGKALTL